MPIPLLIPIASSVVGLLGGAFVAKRSVTAGQKFLQYAGIAAIGYVGYSIYTGKIKLPGSG